MDEEKEERNFNLTINYTTEGKNLNLLKRDLRWVRDNLKKMADLLSAGQTPYDLHFLYGPMNELEDKLVELTEERNKGEK